MNMNKMTRIEEPRNMNKFGNLRLSSSLRGKIYFSTSNVTFKVVACHGVFVVYLELVYFVTALVPSDTACFANSPGSRRRTAVWISLEVMVDLLL